MQDVIINVQANTATATADITSTTVAVDNLTKANQKLENTNEKTGKSFEEVTKNGGAIAIMDQLTGGLASRVRDTYEATKLFNFSLKGMKKALIATGIGALVVALGLIIAYWDDIVALISGANKRLEEQKLAYDDISKKSTDYIKLLQAQKKLIEEEGKGANKITAVLKEKLQLLEKENNKRLEQVNIALKGRLNEEKRKELDQIRNDLILQNFSIRTDLLNLDKEALQVIKEKEAAEEKAILDAEKLAIIKATALEKIRVGQINTQEEIRDEEKNQVEILYKDLLEEARLYYGKDSEQAQALTTSRDEKLKALREKNTEEDKAAQKIIDDTEKERQNILREFTNDQKLTEREEDFAALELQNATLQEQFKDDKDALFDIEFAYLEKLSELKAGYVAEDEENKKKGLEDDKVITDAKKALTLQQVAMAGKAIGDIGVLLKEGTAASKTAALAGIIIQTGVGFVQGLDIAQKSAKGTGPLASLSFPIFYASQVAAVMSSVKQASNILKKVPGGGGGGLNPTPPPIPAQAPSFNIVGQGQGNQIATALGEQQQTPIQTYVVSQDITTAQGLENGIIQGATLGG